MTDTTSTNAPTRHIADLVDGGHTVAMLTTLVGQQHTSRPVTCIEVASGRLSFLVSTAVEWVQDVASGRAVTHLTFADQKDNTYVSVNGTAQLTTDRDEKQRLWSPVARAWFEGPDDPTLGVLHVDVTDGEYWNGPSGKVGQALSILRAVVTRNEDAVGEQGRVVGG